jgi:hypothetical protein
MGDRRLQCVARDWQALGTLEELLGDASFLFLSSSFSSSSIQHSGSLALHPDTLL